MSLHSNLLCSIWHVRLGGANNMHPLNWGAQTEKIDSPQQIIFPRFKIQTESTYDQTNIERSLAHKRVFGMVFPAENKNFRQAEPQKRN